MDGEYAAEIEAHMHKLCAEQAVPKRPWAVPDGNDITGNMRTILLDWLFEVTVRFRLQTETLYRAVALLDRFLATGPLHRSKFQLTGLVCLMIAAKYEEIYPPEVRDYAWIADRAYSCEQYVEFEAKVLAALDFRIGAPTAWEFLARNTAKEPNEDIRRVARLALDSTLIDPELAHVKPANRAHAAYCAALVIVKGARICVQKAAAMVRRILERLAAMMDPKYERRAVWRRHLKIAERLRVNADGVWSMAAEE